MAWKISGELIETCSCNMLCPCWFGEPDLMLMDKGWCATALLLRVRDGSCDGTDLAGLNAILAIHFPGPTLLEGNGTGRVYVDDGTSDAQQKALEAIMQGQSGGGMAVPASLTTTWLPTRREVIAVTESDGKVEVTVGGIGGLASRRLVNEQGQRMTMHNTPFSMAFQFADQVGELSPSDGTTWKDPDMPEPWEGRSGVVGQIAWSG